MKISKQDISMKKYDGEEIIYSINIGDIQDVANQVVDRDLTKKELALVEKSLGDYIDWFQAVEDSIQENKIE